VWLADCPRNGQFVESRIPARFWRVKGVLFHNVIHNFCGYLTKSFKTIILRKNGLSTIFSTAGVMFFRYSPFAM